MSLHHSNDREYINSLALEVKLAFISAHALWVQTLTESFSKFSRKIQVKSIIVSEETFDCVADGIFNQDWDIAIISSPGGLGSEIHLMRSLRTAGCKVKTLLICSHFALPSLNELIELDVHGIVSTSANLSELETCIYSLVDNKCSTLKQQYIKAIRSFNHQLLRNPLDEHENKILLLVAADMTDQEIASSLNISVRTVNYQLPIIYAKLGVARRAGAVGEAMSRGIITPHAVIASKLASEE